MADRTAVVTGASSGIGEATARALAAAGYRVICAARRTDRIEALADEIGGLAVPCDVTVTEEVDRLAETVGDRLDLLVNNAGGALGQKPVAEAEIDAWQRMYDVNVLGAARVTRALLPALDAGAGTVIFVTSTAAEAPYEGGAGYCGVKSAERALAGSLRLELFDRPVRVCEISPGMVHTPEFSLTRFDGDQAKADAVYAGVPGPLVAEDIADAISWMATRPAHVNVDRLVIRPRAQAANHKVFRVSPSRAAGSGS
ncbi:SDR family NAD(P)-dependent oxidoreductase [Micropruina sp.]|uniref:SDR family NAD(P)-dependent oxidoreductase n=1 Tax=Micropruina sp. TaxID=2737536 RepID=UPI0039E50E15